MSPDQFRAIRKAAGLTQAELAQFLGASHRSVQYWETGNRPINGPVGFLMELLRDGVIAPDE